MSTRQHKTHSKCVKKYIGHKICVIFLYNSCWKLFAVSRYLYKNTHVVLVRRVRYFIGLKSLEHTEMFQ
jgi:hypothetical protein